MCKWLTKERTEKVPCAGRSLFIQDSWEMFRSPAAEQFSDIENSVM